jgi:hypothetical protein
MCGMGIEFHVYVRLLISSDKYKSYDMWFLREGLGGVARVLVNVIDLRSYEVRLAFLYSLWFSCCAANKNRRRSPNPSAAVCCSLIIPPLDAMI